MRVLSLFSGIGGFDLGLERAGMTIVGQVEIDPYCLKVLEKHWPNVKRMKDIHDVRGDEFGAVDLVAGGFPCQPVSAAGLRQRQDDARWLWPELVRLIRELRPRFALVENVPGLFDGGMGDVLGSLAASGYDAEWDCIPAAAVGAPHPRDRVWIVAYPRSVGHVVSESIGADVHHRDGHEAAAAQGRLIFQSGTDEDVVTDAHGGGVEGPRPALYAREAEPWRWRGERDFQVLCDNPYRGNDRWPQPLLRRVDDGIPNRVDRLRALGNAVVPQIVEYLGWRILEIDRCR